MTDPRQAPPGRSDPSGRVEADVTAYFPAEPDVIYVKVGGEWVQYERSGPCSGTREDNLAGLNGAREKTAREKTAQETPLKLKDLHWAGHGAGSCHELTPARKRRVYYDPKERPDLFIVRDGEPSARPLPVLDLDGHPQDPEPWLDPETGTRFTGDQARTTTTLLKYAPRAEQPTSSRSRESGMTPNANRTHSNRTTPPPGPPAKTGLQSTRSQVHPVARSQRTAWSFSMSPVVELPPFFRSRPFFRSPPFFSSAPWEDGET